MIDLYLATRTSDQLEFRVRTACKGPLTLHLNDQAPLRTLPAASRDGMHFHRHLFSDLPCDAPFRVTATAGEESSELTTRTLPAPPGKPLLRIGLMADLHLGEERRIIDDYRRGTKRLTGLAFELGEKYIARLAELGSDRIIFTGDVVDPCTPETIGLFKALMVSSSVPCHPIIGNHETWTTGGEARFYRELGLSEGGFSVIRENGVRLLLLSTPEPYALGPGDPQRAWLETQLDKAAPDEDIYLFSHFSLLLHPCVQGVRNDGYQLLDDHAALLTLLEKRPNVRAFVAGHKNVPSLVVRKGVAHLLSPQLIQSPCGYDMLTLYEGGFSRTTWEIDEQDYCEIARGAYENDWPMRFGSEEGRAFFHPFRRS